MTGMHFPASMGGTMDAKESAHELDKAIRITYTNYRHETSVRTIIPEKIWYGVTPWHPEQQWFCDAFDIEKGERRSFAMADIKSWLATTPVARAVSEVNGHGAQR